LRLFVALDIDETIREKISRFVDGARGFAPDERWMSAESLHVTLKFIGEQPEAEVEKIKSSLGTIEGRALEMNIRGYGFFPTAHAPRVFWVGIDAGSSLATLAAVVDEKLSALNIPKEDHSFNPHLTLARGAGRAGSPRWRKSNRSNGSFQHLQEKLAGLPAPEFGRVIANEFFLYQSQLSPRESKYTKLAGFPLH
jgi:RNA 2',3'-cyclic 3'-phosphodiesterase